MQTQKDHVDAYAFLIARMSAALVTADDAFREEPARRAWKGLLIGAALAVLGGLGFFVFGLFVK
ncbi:type VII secretion protein EccB [Amycolatopsis sp. NPDC058986]|uniref:type VII secretion protein EccB n=1 Tax=unclassified Amycolatopsis TaxID=2618356 RepID=UPI00366D65A2